ncbi:MAG: hypothetical protein N3A63_07890 [Bacteroidetes bacterium]|nr:hypothetical protein [Bacteroidota bacterium]
MKNDSCCGKKILVHTIILSIIACTFVFAQESANRRFAALKLLARSAPDSIVLRWAPDTPGGWVIANSLGYIVERATIDPVKGVEESHFTPLVNRPIKPLSLEEWKQYAGPTNDFSAIAVQAVYGKRFVPQATNQNAAAVLSDAANELTNRFSFALYAADNDAVTAQALGLRFVDTKVRRGERYVYKVYVAVQTPDYSFDTAYVMIEAKETPPADPPLGFRAESGDGIIKLFWSVSAPLGFSGYYVYRSADNGKTFSRMNTVPIVVAQISTLHDGASPCFIDTATVNYRKYRYRLVGVTPFGDFSKPIEVTAFSRDLTPPPAPIVATPRQLSPTRIKLTWEQSVVPKDFKGFVITRSIATLDSMVLRTPNPLPATQHEFIDVLTENDEAYYAVAAVDTAGNYAFSLPVYIALIDSLPPPPPKGLRGKIHSNGKVTLWWQPVKKRNILGYRVFYANDPTHDFTPLTGHVHTDTVYIDSVNLSTLTKKLYYKIAAVDKQYQHSAFSEILTLQRPDVVPPSAPVFRDVVATDSSVQLTWHCSVSKDVSHQLLLRREEKIAQWKVLDSLKATVSKYIDTRVKQREMYIYTLVSVDSSGLRSEEAVPVAARPYDTGKRSSVQQLTATYDRKTNTVTLRWKYLPKEQGEYWFVLYKAVGNGEFKEYGSLKANARSATDTNPARGRSTYGILVLTSDGGQSEMVTVNVNN